MMDLECNLDLFRQFIPQRELHKISPMIKLSENSVILAIGSVRLAKTEESRVPKAVGSHDNIRR